MHTALWNNCWQFSYFWKLVVFVGVCCSRNLYRLMPNPLYCSESGLRLLLTGDFVAFQPVDQRALDGIVFRNVDQRVQKHVAVGRQDHQSPGNAVETWRHHLNVHSTARSERNATHYTGYVAPTHRTIGLCESKMCHFDNSGPIFTAPKVLFLALSVIFLFVYTKCHRNRWTDLRRIHREDVFVPSVGRLWRSRSIRSPACGLCLEKHLCSS